MENKVLKSFFEHFKQRQSAGKAVCLRFRCCHSLDKKRSQNNSPRANSIWNHSCRPPGTTHHYSYVTPPLRLNNDHQLSVDIFAYFIAKVIYIFFEYRNKYGFFFNYQKFSAGVKYFPRTAYARTSILSNPGYY